MKETRAEALRTMTTLFWGKHGVRRVRVRIVRMRRARVRRVTRVSLSHSQRDLVAQEVGVICIKLHTLVLYLQLRDE